MPLVYLDNSATAPPWPEVVTAATAAMTDAFGNPSSLHRLGAEAEKLVGDARKAVAALIGASPATIVFTSGGSEANNLAIKGAAAAFVQRGRHIVTTRAEHPSVLRAGLALTDAGYEVTQVPVNSYGMVEAAAVLAAVRPDTVLVSVMHVNNETGAVGPVAAIGRGLRHTQTLFHVDAVQSAGKIPVNVEEIGCDLLTVSAHKIHGPKGIGALYIRPKLRLKPLIDGGGQEGGVRSGTENVPGIAGFGAAARQARGEAAGGLAHRLAALKHETISGLRAAKIDFIINGPELTESAPHILNISFSGIPRGEVLVHALAEQGIFVSTGSACHSRRPQISPVLAAMNISGDRALGAIRISFAAQNTTDDAVQFVQAAARVIPMLRAMIGR